MCVLKRMEYKLRARNVLFNDALNTFYIQLYGVRHMVKDHSDSKETRCRHIGYSSINSKGSFICTIPDRITHTTAFVTPVVEHWLEREIAQWVLPMKDGSDDPWANTTSELRPAHPASKEDTPSPHTHLGHGEIDRYSSTLALCI